VSVFTFPSTNMKLKSISAAFVDSECFQAENLLYFQ